MSGWYSYAVPIPQKAITPGDRSGFTASGLDTRTLFVQAVIDVLLDLEEYSTGPAADELSGHPPFLRVFLTVSHPSPGLAVMSRALLGVKEPR